MKKLVHSIILSASLLMPFQTVALADSTTSINDGIWNLTYDRNAVLASPGESVSSFIPKEGLNQNGKFVVVERKKKSLSTSPVDISIVDSVTDRTYPGALQLANQSFVDNRPDLLKAKRQPIAISIDLPGLGKQNTTIVDNPTYGNVSAAIDDMVANWSKNQAPTYTLPARTQYSEAMVYSKSQISSALNVNAKVLENALGIDFHAVASGEKKMMIAAYKQIFYTVSAELPNSPADLFDASVTFDELKRKGVSNDTPPVLVSNVAYGRTIYVKLETTSNSKDVQAAFNALIKGVDVKANASYKNVLDESTFTAVVLGGDAAEHNKIISKDFDEIRGVIKNHAAFSLRNPAYPISYTSTFLKDNAIAAVHNKTEYVETTATEYSASKIKLHHKGAYVAQFAVAWDEFTYDVNGNEIVTRKEWSDSWRDRTASYSTIIAVPANARNVSIYARECTGLAWEWWRTVVNETNVPLGGEITVTIGGTTLSPYGTVDVK